MTTETPEVTVAQIRGRIRPTHMYYRQRNGWITVEAATFIERAKFSERGWTPLMDYPPFDMGHVWCADNPLATLFQFGGAKELPLDQIIQNGFYFRPYTVPACRMPQTESHNHTSACYQGAKPVVFPQLEGVKIDGPFPCRFCGREPFATLAARGQHEEVSHKDERTSIRTGETLADHLAKGLREGNQPPSLPTRSEVFATHPDLQEIVDSTETGPATRLPYICGVCDADFSNLTAFGKHVEGHAVAIEKKPRKARKTKKTRV